MSRALGRLPRLLRSRLGAAAGGLALACAGVVAWVHLPVPEAMLAPPSGQGISLLDRHGRTLRSTRAADGSHQRWTPYDRIDPDLINAFVAVEDRRFWEHGGIDPRAVARAVRDNAGRGRVVSGASTITMQLARLLRPAPRSMRGKLVQAMWAIRLERSLGKQQVLEQYLNRVHLGQATVGVEAATALYFDASPGEVSLGQAAALAGLAHAPSRDNPFASPKRSRARRAHALRRIRALRLASRDDVDRAAEEPLALPRRRAPFLAPHFTARVIAAADSASAHPGELYTSLSLELQAAVEAEVQHTVTVLRDRGVEHAAAVVLDNESGEVLAWVGSPDFHAERDGQTDMVVSARQPGSALKPFLYALALDRGVTAATVLPDLPRAYATATGSYSPRNYDRRFRGPVRVREALASSYNVPAVELAQRVGTPSLLQTLRLAGFTSLRRDAEHYGLGLALGNGDVTLLELANGYRALANLGEWRPWRWTLAQPSRREPPRRVAGAAASAIVLDMLADPSARIPGFGLVTPFEFPFPVAVKTGTSRHFTDNWAVGTTRRFTVAVWAGNFSGRPMQGVSGVTGAGPLLARTVSVVARHLPPGALPTPAEAGAVPVQVCRLSGLRATNECLQLSEWFVRGSEPLRTDDWERGGSVTLPAEYAAWSAGQSGSVGDSPVTLAGAPSSPAVASAATDAGAVDTALARRFRILAPLDGDRYAVPSDVEAGYATLALRAGGPGASGVRWSVNGVAVRGARWSLRPGRHVVRAVSAGGATDEVAFEVVP